MHWLCVARSAVCVTFAVVPDDESALLILLSDSLTRLLQLRGAIPIHYSECMIGIG